MTTELIDYGVPATPSGVPAPIPDAVASGGIAVSVQVPLRPDGNPEDGDIQAQTTAVLVNLCTTLDTMGLGLDRVMHATIYMTDMNDWEGMNAVWESVFQERSPSRAAIGATALAEPWMQIELVALIAHHADNRPPAYGTN
jgi:2-iminobutanoate/2-iminopropanoate deaminase